MIRNSPAMAVGLLSCALATSCAPSPPSDEATPAGDKLGTAAPDHEALVATWEGGSLSTEALDQAILALPPADRQVMRSTASDGDQETLEPLRDLIREMAVDDILIREAKLLGIDQQPDFQRQLRDIERKAVAERYLAANLPPGKTPSDAELRRAYDEQADSMARNERRFVYNIFRRITPDAPREVLVAELEAIRARILAGEIAGGQGIGVLAEKISDSESRHNKGRLGWFERGQLSPQLDDVIFGLEEGVPSAPIVTRDGVHLFYVDVVVDAKRFTFDEMKRNLATSLATTERSDAITALADALATDFEIFMVTAEELESLHRRGDPSVEVLRVGDYQLQLGQLVNMVANNRAQQPGTVETRPMKLLESLKQAEVIYQHQLATGEPLAPEASQAMAQTTDRLLALHLRQERVRAAVESAPEDVRAFFEANRRRFSSPLEIKLERLSVPLREEQAAQDMARLEQFRQQLEAGDTTFEAVAESVGGTLEAIDFSTLAQLTEQEPKLARFAPDVAIGRHSAPFSTPQSLELIRVVDRREPEPLAFEAVREQVRAAYLERHGQRLYEALRTQILDEATFRLFDTALARPDDTGFEPERAESASAEATDEASRAHP